MESLAHIWADPDTTTSHDSTSSNAQKPIRLQTSSSTSSLDSDSSSSQTFRRVISDNTLTRRNGPRSFRRRSVRSSEEKLATTSSLNLKCDELLLESPIASNKISMENQCPKNFPHGNYSFSTSENLNSGLGTNRYNINQAMGSAFHIQRPSRKRPAPDSLLNNAQKQSVVAVYDRAIHSDPRCLRAMLDSEQVPSSNTRTSSRRARENRLKTVIWMKEVCSETNSDLVVMPLAISYMDRFLAAKSTPAEKFQELGAACLLLASKMKAPVPLSPKRIGDFTDHGVSVSKILEWEIVIVNTLSWDLCTSTPFEFFDQLLARIPALEAIRTKIAHAIYWLFKDEILAMLPSSVQAALSVLFAVDEYVRAQAYHHNSQQYCSELVSKVEAILRDEFQYEIETLRAALRNAISRKVFSQVSESHVAEQCANHVLREEDEEFRILPNLEPFHFVTLLENTHRPRNLDDMNSQTSDLSPSIYTRTERMFSSAVDIYETPSSSISTTRNEHGRYTSDDSGFNSEVSTPETARTTMVFTTTYAYDASHSRSSKQSKKSVHRRFSDSL